MSVPDDVTYTFPSIEQILVKWIKSRVSVHVLTELPHDFQDPAGPTNLLPVIVVDRISGAELDGSPIIDRPVVDVDCYGSSRGQAQSLAEQVRHELRWTLPGSRVDGVVFTRTRTVVGPRSLPHANPKIRRYSAHYELLMHVQP